jgi:hypothetical protein
VTDEETFILRTDDIEVTAWMAEGAAGHPPPEANWAAYGPSTVTIRAGIDEIDPRRDREDRFALRIEVLEQDRLDPADLSMVQTIAFGRQTLVDLRDLLDDLLATRPSRLPLVK